MYRTILLWLIRETKYEYIGFTNNITITTRNKKKVKSAVPISAAMVCLNGLSTKSDKRTKKKNNPEKIVFFDIDGKIKLLLFNI